MALKGNLRDFTITQLLNLVNLARKTGTLLIEGQGSAARITFREGKLAFAQIGQEDNSLAAILQQSRKINAGQYKALKTRATSMTDKELGLLLINAGYLSQEDILTSLQQYFVGVVRRLFTWMDGFFRFEPDMSAPDDKIAVRVDLENLIVEGARQLRELETLQQEIPSLDVALKFTDRPGTNLKQVNLSVEEWKVVSYVNPKNSIRQIARATHLNDLDIRRVVYSLMQAGLVELIRLNTGVLPAAKVMTPVEKEKQTSLVNRLINRIRSL